MKQDEPDHEVKEAQVDIKRRAALAKLAKLSGIGAASTVAMLSSTRTAAAS